MTILRWALLFFLISIVAGVLGFTGISAATADIARFLFYVFVVIFLVLLFPRPTLFRHSGGGETGVFPSLRGAWRRSNPASFVALDCFACAGNDVTAPPRS